MRPIIICGTLAYDIIGNFAVPLGSAPRNVKLLGLHEGFGGCAMNIAYGLARLGHPAVPLVYVGDDYGQGYRRHVMQHGIQDQGIIGVPGTLSARGFVFTGSDQAQFTAFHPGPSGLDRLPADIERLIVANDFAAAVIAPDVAEKSLACARGLMGIPLRVWCPGQYAESATVAYAREMLEHATMVIANRLEWQSLERTLGGWLPDRSDLTVVITDGANPVVVEPDGIRVLVPLVAEERMIDPTGCGDAFVAGLLNQLLAGKDLPSAIQEAIAFARQCLAVRGAQAH